MIKAYIYIQQIDKKSLNTRERSFIIIPNRFAYDNNINSGRLKYFFSTTLKSLVCYRYRPFFIYLYCCSNNFRQLNENGKKTNN